MRILQAHNYYRTSAPSGEDNVVESERALLREYGHTVEQFVRRNDDLEAMGARGAILGAASTPWNPFSASAIKRAVTEFDADIVHAHNTFPQLSPSVYSAVDTRAGRVLTLHNYRPLCAAAIPMRDGHVCIECVEKQSSLPSLKYGCYRGSRAATLPLAAQVSLHRLLGTWQRHVDAFIVLTEFQREMMVKGGFPSELLHVKPNFFPGWPKVHKHSDRPERVLFLGRHTQEKGVQDLIAAWRLWGEDAPQLRIAGDGELRNRLEREAAGLPIKFLGQIGQQEARSEIANSRLLVVPSICFEGFPMVLQEAFALGTPAAVSDVGPLPSLVKSGMLGGIFAPRNPASLLEEVRRLVSDQAVLGEKSLAARRTFEKEYTQDANVKALVQIYETAIAVKKERRKK